MGQPKKRILIVNCYFPEMREPIKRRNEVPDALVSAVALPLGRFGPGVKRLAFVLAT